jgi:PAS domain S-box-containing protein
MTRTPVIPGDIETPERRVGTSKRHRKSIPAMTPPRSQGEEHSRQLVDLLPNSVLVLRRETIIHANPVVAALFGATSAEQLIGRRSADLVHPDDRAGALRHRARVETGQSLPPVTITGLRLDGASFDVEWRESGIDWDGEPATLLVLREITEGTESEAAERAAHEHEDLYRSLVEMSPDGIMVHTGGIVVYANARLAEIMGADSPDRLIGKQSIDFVSPEDRPAALARRRKVAAGQAVDVQEARFLRFEGGGRPRWNAPLRRSYGAANSPFSSSSATSTNASGSRPPCMTPKSVTGHSTMTPRP